MYTIIICICILFLYVSVIKVYTVHLLNMLLIRHVYTHTLYAPSYPIHMYLYLTLYYTIYVKGGGDPSAGDGHDQGDHSEDTQHGYIHVHTHINAYIHAHTCLYTLYMNIAIHDDMYVHHILEQLNIYTYALVIQVPA